MAIDLKWIIGQRIKETRKEDYTWIFVFDGCGIISTESAWRLMTEESIKITSEDHEQMFGLQAPLDAINILNTTINQQIINQYKLDPRTGDFSLVFENAFELQFLNLSSGYESWHVVNDVQEVICLGGGKLHVIENQTK